MSEVLASCIIPTRNRHILLQNAIHSVVSQTYENLEIIVVDDASDDSTESVVRELMTTDGRIKYFRNNVPMGGSGARNVGINAATGEYIAFLDDDDEWKQHKIATQLEAITNFDAVLCASILNNNKAGNRYHRGIVSASDLKKGNIFTGGTSILMARSSVIKSNLFDEKLVKGQDWDLLIRIALKYRIGYQKDLLVYYNTSNHTRITNQSINMSVDQLAIRMSVIYKHRPFLGSRWFNYHIAHELLSYIKIRHNKYNHLRYTIRRCGMFAVSRVFLNKIIRCISRI